METGRYHTTRNSKRLPYRVHPKQKRTTHYLRSLDNRVKKWFRPAMEVLCPYTGQYGHLESGAVL